MLQKSLQFGIALSFFVLTFSMSTFAGPGRGGDAYASLFVQIPAGWLPGEKSVGSFEMSIAPVTRAFWQEIMPDYIPEQLRFFWDDCLTCPVTYVAYENKGFSPDNKDS